MSTKTIDTSSELSADKQDNDYRLAFTKMVLSPEVSNSLVLEAFKHDTMCGETNFLDVVEVINNTTNEMLESNSMEHVERLLLSQAIALNGLFASFACRASEQKDIKQIELYMRLALKAQTQSKATLETLSVVKNPPVYARTANIAQNQQINNGALPVQRKSERALTPEKGAPVPIRPSKNKQELTS